MKSTGVVRPVDNMGRVVIPREIRKQLGVENSVDSFEIYIEDDKVVLKKYQTACVFCGSTDECVEYKDRCVCADCIERLNKAKEEKAESEQTEQ